ncbi:MAG: hypothetical protein Q8N05_02650 [Bacteroidota bacterium]|nr:hypothetical protein [Bacteroidota bacterium]
MGKSTERLIQDERFSILEYNGKAHLMETIWKASGPDDCFGSGCIVPTSPIIEETESEKTLLKTTYYGDRMKPTLKAGDGVVLRKINPNKFIEWGEIFLIQIDSYNIFCRVSPGIDKDSIKISYDNPEDKIIQEISLSQIQSIWKLIATARIN